MSRSQSRVAVIIPHYQHKPGVLRRALTSVFRQRGDFTCEVLIADDGSPAPAIPEIPDFATNGRRMRITVVGQRNAGPGAARNAALDAVSDRATHVAFLDSDDAWRPDHLQNALRALDFGHDFYFSDHLFSDYRQSSAFIRSGKPRLAEHRLLDRERGIYEFRGDMTDQILIDGNVIGTSTVVYRFRPHAELRFHESFYNGQDYLFWLDFCRRTRRFVFSTDVECEYGLGVNIYTGAGWGTERLLTRLTNELQLWQAVRKLYPLTSAQDAGAAHKIDRIRESIVRDILHRVTHRKGMPSDLLRRIVQIDPLILTSGVLLTLRLTNERLRGLRAQ